MCEPYSGRKRTCLNYFIVIGIMLGCLAFAGLIVALSMHLDRREEMKEKLLNKTANITGNGNAPKRNPPPKKVLPSFVNESLSSLDRPLHPLKKGHLYIKPGQDHIIKTMITDKAPELKMKIVCHAPLHPVECYELLNKMNFPDDYADLYRLRRKIEYAVRKNITISDDFGLFHILLDEEGEIVEDYEEPKEKDAIDELLEKQD